MDVTVCVGTFGDRSWIDLAERRAIPSAEAQGVPVVHEHGKTLARARNAALRDVATELVVFLDADDELEPGYIQAMLAGAADLRVPMVRYVHNNRPRGAAFPRVAGHHHDCTAECVASGDGNWLVVGTAARTQAMRDAGGWQEWMCYEDYDLWMRMILRGATVERIPAAVYRAHVNPQSRNRAPAMTDKNAVHRAINQANLGQEVIAA